MSSAIAHVVGNGADISFNFTTMENPSRKYLNDPKYPQSSKLHFTRVTIKVNSLPEGEVSPDHSYHIHENSISSDCHSAGGHHDHHEHHDHSKHQSNHGSHGSHDHHQEEPASHHHHHSGHCDPTNFNTCEVGDLSGKHGTIKGTQTVVYVDRLPSVDELINYSIVVHDSADSSKRIACANFNIKGHKH